MENRLTSHHIIYGPPGTGKTSSIMDMVASLRNSGVGPDQIMFLSHTKAAAKEALSRLKLHSSASVMTTHALAYRALGLTRERLVTKENFKIFAEAVNVPFKMGDLDSEDGIEIGDELMAIYQNARVRKLDVMAAYDLSHRPASTAVYKMVIQSYADWKASQGLVDFTDMLHDFVHRSHFSSNITHLFVDEAQDLSPLQWDVISVLTKLPSLKSCTVVGDDDQSIFEWGGADPFGMARYADDNSANETVLTQSYRVPRLVHELAQRTITKIAKRKDKDYQPTKVDGSIDKYGTFDKVQFKLKEDTLILVRTGNLRRDIERTLIKHNVPYLTEGGYPSPWQTGTAKGLRLLHKLREAKNGLTSHELEDLRHQATDEARIALRNKEMSFLKWPNHKIIKFNPKSAYFYRNFDPTVTPTIRLSTIHMAKGREADHVVLHTGLTQRIHESMSTKPDPEHRVFYVGVTRAKQKLSIVSEGDGYAL